MLEFPEVSTMARQLTETVSGSVVADVRPPTKPHKFCWFGGVPAEYGDKLRGCKIAGAEGFGLFVELLFDNGLGLCFNDGVNVRLVGKKDAPKEYQLLLLLEDGRALAFTVAMYGGIVLHGREYDEPYYLKSRNAVPPSAPGFAAYFEAAFNACKPSLSVKAFLAAEQRFPRAGQRRIAGYSVCRGDSPEAQSEVFEQGGKGKIARLCGIGAGGDDGSRGQGYRKGPVRPRGRLCDEAVEKYARERLSALRRPDYQGGVSRRGGVLLPALSAVDGR